MGTDILKKQTMESDFTDIIYTNENTFQDAIDECTDYALNSSMNEDEQAQYMEEIANVLKQPCVNDKWLLLAQSVVFHNTFGKIIDYHETEDGILTKVIVTTDY